ncbi:MAG: hypothetical protein IPJ73_20675 [Zoogloea sp.]|nr:hypothetical protein [Zoogloea sp.]
MCRALRSHDFPRDSICNSYAETYLLCGAGIADAYQTLLTVMGLQPYLLVTEYYNVDIRHYFRTGARSDSAFILAGNAGKGWRDTYDYFLAWRDASSGAQAVCRFYAKGPNSTSSLPMPRSAKTSKTTQDGYMKASPTT